MRIWPAIKSRKTKDAQMKIQVQQIGSYPCDYRAKLGKRLVLISLPNYQRQLGIIPSDSSVRTAFNDTSAPGDKLVDDSVPVQWIGVSKFN